MAGRSPQAESAGMPRTPKASPLLKRVSLRASVWSARHPRAFRGPPAGWCPPRVRAEVDRRVLMENTWTMPTTLTSPPATHSRFPAGFPLFTILAFTAAALFLTSCSCCKSSENPNVKKTETAIVREGVPGGTFIETYEGSGTITAIDQEKRTFSMVRPDGTAALFKAGPELVNFPQLRVGDKVKATLTDEMVVSVRKKDAPAVDGEATAVVLAPKGAKPGGVVADTVQITAIVQAVDLEHHKATLKFPDGKTTTVAVRPDVEL